ncbi:MULTISPECIES: DUF3035 domain-containing protein [unclassified Sphingomonas]|jgi:hypothetical protein|uniref:DUF3035 domain-containing protein n=1 Tax=unclassified Sphingomonas TaxID=196159 RepID=UPI000835EF6F|nr:MULTISPECIES: DUF3035 domain-containing protein [unclassified Sphingomonas]
MRKRAVPAFLPALLSGGLILSLGACGSSGLNRERPDEFAVARQAPLVIPPDYSLVPPQPGVARPQDNSPASQALDALFGGEAPRSETERAALREAGADTADAGVRSAVGDPSTLVLNKGPTTRDIIAAPEGDGQTARVAIGG